MSRLDKKNVLQLNANWVPIGSLSSQDAFICMSRILRASYRQSYKRPYCALNIDYEMEDGKPIFSKPSSLIPVTWEEWVELPVRSFDEFVTTSSKTIRIPTVIIANNYKEVPRFYPKFSKNAVWERDQYTCQITGDKVTKKSANIDHYIPRSLRGTTSYENCFVTRKDLNSKRGNMPMDEFCKKFGYPVPAKPKQPNFRKIAIDNIHNVKDWEIFLKS